MGQNNTVNLRAVALVGHGAAGKTTLVESLLAASGVIASRGTDEKGNTEVIITMSTAPAAGILTYKAATN